MISWRRPTLKTDRMPDETSSSATSHVRARKSMHNGWSTWRASVIFACVAGFFAAGCGASQKAKSTSVNIDDLPVTQVFEIDTVVIRARAIEDDDAIDLRNVFDEASAYCQAE